MLVAAAWFGTLGVRPLYKADESRYAEIPREMAASGDWVTPRLNGFKYFEKPPLQYWASAAIFKVLGERDWAARLWAAALGFAGILLAMAAANRLFAPPAGYLAAAILAGSPLYVVLGQITTLDMGVSFFLSAAIFAFALGHMLVFWAACALAVLSKGLIGIVLPGVAIGLYILVKWDWSLVKKIRPFAGGALFLAICAPWFIAVSIANPEFLHFFFIQEHFERFTTEMHRRAQPAWYFVPVLLIGMGPWILPLVFSIVKAVREPAAGKLDARLFFVLWALVVFVFFSASGSKLPSYILPMFPPLAVLLGAWIAATAPRRLLVAQAALTVAGTLVMAALLPRLGASYPQYTPWLVGAMICGAALGLMACVLAWRNALGAAVLALAAAGLVATQVALIGHRTLAPLYSAAGLIGAAQPPVPAGVRVFAVDAYDHSIPWYLRRTVTMVGYKDELGKAIGWDPEKFIPDQAGFAKAWAGETTAYAVVAARDFERLSAALPMQLVSRDPRYVLVRKP